MIVVGLLVAAPSWARPATLWSAATEPSEGPAEAIGGYSNGCLAGAVAVRKRGRNFRLARPERHRNFAHPELASFIEDLAKAMKKKHLGLLYLGDLSQPRGGPSVSGHASHQSGLDADLWYLEAKRGAARSVVDERRKRPSRHWSRRVPVMLALAAQDPRVARIFVHPVIKRSLCRNSKGDRAWLRKLRPWWGHDSHFHVRLHCPAASPSCEPQAPLPDGDGCNELDWWFSEKASADRSTSRSKYQSKVGAQPVLPQRCTDVGQRVSGLRH